MKPSPLRTHHQQFGGLPYRILGRAKVEFCLVTSRDTHQWVIPKGNPMFRKGRLLSAWDVASIEAQQEAGVTGKVCPKSIGAFPYDKRTDEGKILRCDVDVFLIRVEQELQKWKEKDARIRAWLSTQKAILYLRHNSNLPDSRKVVRLLKKAEACILKKNVKRKTDAVCPKSHGLRRRSRILSVKAPY